MRRTTLGRMTQPPQGPATHDADEASTEHPVHDASTDGVPPGQHLVLASQSASRLALLQAAGIEPRVHASGVDEDAALARAEELIGASLAPDEVALTLARAKCEAVAGTAGPFTAHLLLELTEEPGVPHERHEPAAGAPSTAGSGHPGHAGSAAGAGCSVVAHYVVDGPLGLGRLLTQLAGPAIAADLRRAARLATGCR